MSQLVMECPQVSKVLDTEAFCDLRVKQVLFLYSEE